ncbi:ribonuclease E [Burkholderia ambifaria MEX-5]|uniref:Ribonuclease E n=1 Tax=Burkholderia ambifaria MEX-5 TaxID=396597 RepID=B1TCS4_9BURK|nr:ribonuclease E [Burkholderia ambifaria MEX-5]
MQFVRGMHRIAADGLGARIADARELLADRLAGAVGARQPVFERIDAREHAGRDHRGREARTFLVGPDHDVDRALGLDARIVQRAHDLESAEYAVDAVIAAAGRLRIGVRARHHWRGVGIAARAAREHVAHPIHPHRAAGVARPLHEQVARLAVEIGQRETAYTALWRRADLRHPFERCPQPRAVDPRCACEVVTHCRPPLRRRAARPAAHSGNRSACRPA